MNKNLISFVFGMFIIPLTFSQDYSYTIVDNSDFENCAKYGVKTCHMYNFPDMEKAPNDSILVNSYYYNKSGLVTLEINYLEPQDTTQKWILTAQYDGATILTEQWKWENNDIDSTTFYYDEEGLLKKSCIRYYFEGEFDEMECEEYVYKDGEYISLAFPDLIDVIVKKSDTTYHYYQNGNLRFKETNGLKVIAYSYADDGQLTAKYYFTYNTDGELETTIRTDAEGNITGEFKNTFSGTLLIEQSEYDARTGLRGKNRFNYTYFE